MSENLLIALQITLIGMSLVFGVIVVLWIVMSLLVRLTTPRTGPIEEAAAPGPVDQSDVKRARRHRCRECGAGSRIDAAAARIS